MNDEVYYRHIEEAIEKIYRYIYGISFLEFSTNELIIDGVVRQLEIIGEAANQMSSEGRKKLAAIPWPDVISMRNKLIHEYFGVDVETVWTTVQEDIPLLRDEIKKIFLN